MSALECTKSGIEHLIKHLPQVKPIDKHNDKYMLVTYDDGMACIKSSLKDPLSHLVKELKLLRANDLSNPGASLSTIFDFLNAYRVHNGLDTPATGRFPGTIEPTIILWFTDGGRQASSTVPLERLNIPGITTAGVDYYHEPFRWDQRLYNIFLEPNTDMVDQQLGLLSTVMGGARYYVRTLRHMLQAIDCMLGISKIPPTQYSPQAVLHIYGVVVNFEDLIVDPRRPNTVNHHQLVYVNPTWLNAPRHSGFFPIPEAYWPESEGQRLPTRNAQPTLHYHTKEEKSVEIPEGFPYDKYVVAPSPMTQELLTRPPGSCWPVYVKNSYKTEGFGFPFGFLRASTQKNAVTLTVVAYNYPALFTLLVHLNSTGRTPTAEWLRDFEEYLSHTPSYYITPLKNAFKRMGIFNITSLEQGGASSQGISKILAKNKMQAKTDLERFTVSESHLPADPVSSKKKTLCANAFDVPRSELVSVLTELKRAFFKDLQLIAPTSTIASVIDSPLPLSLTAPKHSATAKAARSRLESLMDSDDLHSLPIADMGIYQDRMQKIQQENLRDPFRDEETSKSLQRTMFGNPYKQDKKVSIDEEDEASAADQSVSSTGTSNGSSLSSLLGRKRKPRRRSVSPSHFQIEKIPSLTPGDHAITTKIQTVSLGAVSAEFHAPALGIVIKDSSGKAPATNDLPDRHMVMHDGEDEDDEDDDFRRAMFNSDEMELDGDDEAARLRADTPMPGGMGLDDDDEEASDLQHAQDMIPPPLTNVSMEDIQAELTGGSAPHQRPLTDSLEDDGYRKHREDVEQDLKHLQGTSSPVFESLVYDPSALMKLQSIPQMFPSLEQMTLAEPRLDQDLTTTTEQQGTTIKSSQGRSDHEQPGLIPIPYLLPSGTGDESNTLSSAFISDSQRHREQAPTSAGQPTSEDWEMDHGGDEDSVEISNYPTSTLAVGEGLGTSLSSTGQLQAPSLIAITTPGESPPRVDSAPPEQSSRAAPELYQNGELQRRMARTPLEFKNRLLKEMKKTKTDYNEGSILEQIVRLDSATNWTKEQKKQAVAGCSHFARALRREAVAMSLELLLQKIK
ncbi:Integrator complex subunit 6 [Gryganskiella cystojenkinii]|nr:Integrator complex subunit 6 [Gryganskiella cystojenkinii]